MKKKILSIVGIVVLIGGLLCLYIKSCNEVAELKNANKDYQDKISSQTSDPTSYTLDEGTYNVGGPIPAGTVTLIALTGSGSYYVLDDDDLQTSGLIGDYDASNSNKNFITITKVVLKKGQKLKIKGDNLKLTLIYNMID